MPGWGSYRGKDQVPGFFAAIGSNVDIKLFYLRGSEDSEQSGFA